MGTWRIWLAESYYGTFLSGQQEGTSLMTLLCSIPPGGLIHGSHWLKQGLSLILKERERENELAKELFIDVKLLTIYPIVLFGLE